ncbi:hypothetical protein [Actinomadura harenae]|nr:hypothetical protein [Actinomadura harenae]
MWIVSLSDGVRIAAQYGPMRDEQEARGLAQFLAALDAPDALATAESVEASSGGVQPPPPGLLARYRKGGAE